MRRRHDPARGVRRASRPTRLYDQALRNTDWDGTDGGGYGSNWLSAYPFKHGGTQSPGVATGVVFGRSEINFRQVEDGTTNTYMVGEKYMSTDNYDDGLDSGDNEPAFSGNNADTLPHDGPCPRTGPPAAVGPDKPGSSENDGERRFGSAHSAGFNMAMCDASVRFVQFDVDPEVHRARGHRSDGVVRRRITESKPNALGFQPRVHLQQRRDHSVRMQALERANKPVPIHTSLERSVDS